MANGITPSSRQPESCYSYIWTGSNLPVITEGKIDRYVPSISKAKNKLGLQIKIDLPNAIRLTVNDLIKQMH